MFRPIWTFAATAMLVFAAIASSQGGQPAALGKPASQDELLAVLRGEASLTEKWQAAHALAVRATRDAVPALAALLADEKLSDLARCALESMPDPAADDALRAALPNLKGRLLVGVIDSIGVRRDAKAVEPLSKLLGDGDAEVASAAAWSLGRIGAAPAAKALEQAEAAAPAAVKPALYEALLRCAEAAASEGRRDEALAVYERLRGAQMPNAIRMGALRGAIVARGPAGAAVLLELLGGNDLIAHSAALRVAAHELPGAEATASLADGLAKLPADKQAMLIRSLGIRGDAAAVPALLAAAKSTEKPVRLAAIRALPQLGKPEAVPALAEAAADADAQVAQAAQIGLASLPGKEADAAILALLDSADANRQALGIQIASLRRLAAAMPALLKSAGGADPGLRVAALNAAGELAGDAQVPALLDLLANAPGAPERDAAERALVAFTGRSEKADACADAAIARVADAQPAAKCALVRVLRAAGGAKALQAVRAAVADPQDEVKRAAVRSLSEWKTADAANDLLELAKILPNATDKLLCLRGCITFAGNPALPAPQRMDICKQAAALIERNDEKKLLLSSLGGIATEESLAMVLPHLDNAATKEEAGAAVVSIAAVLLRDGGAAAHGPKLAEPLEKVVQATENKALATRARTLLQRARTAPGKK